MIVDAGSIGNFVGNIGGVVSGIGDAVYFVIKDGFATFGRFISLIPEWSVYVLFFLALLIVVRSIMWFVKYPHLVWSVVVEG